MKSDITIIIPVHEITTENEGLYTNAIQSVNNQLVKADELLIVVPENSDAEEFVTNFDYGDMKDNVRFVKNSGETDFASQMNLGVESTETTWFCMLEFDDEVSAIWLKNAVKYIEVYDEVDLFLPIIVDTNANGQFIGLTNEAVWANDFSDEMGVLSEDALLMYQNFNIDGMVAKKDMYIEFGGIKPSMKLTFIYEFLLRLVHHSNVVMVIPRFGYKHMNQRENSLFNTYQSDLNALEAKWWLSRAKKEYFFINDREITYEGESV
jgi:hypothetical protein